ncbi:O-antigen ligase-like membrane protein [Crenobacter luteus]|uniref:O-antigen ligase family protein n=1 Tax=Crenobacter luteus TaxID=1452487 RepID=UPI0010F0238A|nr:O-antigen ligase family protein [Crenobacter luteus]TCP13083.1 O-antigen ligase-like membrane protein [Crenobacter luteus]
MTRLLASLPGFAPRTEPVWLSRLAWGLLLLLAFIWPIPNGQLPFHRNFPLLLSFFAMLYLFYRLPADERRAALAPYRALAWLLLLLSAWILLTGLWHSPRQWGYLGTFNGKWLRVLQTGFMGLLVLPLFAARGEGALGARRLFCYLLVAMWLVPLLQSLDVLWLWFKLGSLPWMQTRLGYSKMEMSVHINLVASFLFAELAARLVAGRRWLPLSWPVLLFMLATCLFSGLAIATRNATIGLAGMVLSLTLMAVLFRARDWGWAKTLGGLGAGLLLLAVVAGVSWQSDPRWKTFVQTVPLSLDTERYQSWRDREAFPLPALPDGGVAEVSAYERIAWIKIGSQLILREPLGQGIAGDNFHRLVERYYGESKTTSQSHSGVINFALANGIPGLLLWLLLLGALVYAGGRAFYRDGLVPGLFLMMLVLSYAGRSLIDDVLRDHMLEMFFFLTMLLLALCRAEKAEAPLRVRA